jgi:hypothetical protein
MFKLNIKLLLYINLLFIGNYVFCQQVKKAETGNFLLKNATIHTITKGIVTGDVLIYLQR